MYLLWHRTIHFLEKCILFKILTLKLTIDCFLFIAKYNKYKNRETPNANRSRKAVSERSYYFEPSKTVGLHYSAFICSIIDNTLIFVGFKSVSD